MHLKISVWIIDLTIVECQGNSQGLSGVAICGAENDHCFRPCCLVYLQSVDLRVQKIY